MFVFASSGMEGNGLTVNVGGRTVTTDGEMVTGSYFSVLGVSPLLGRAIVDDDLSAASPNVAVITHAFWSREFGGDCAAAGRSIAVNGVPFTIVGGAPRGFVGLHGAVPDLWVPLRPTDDMRPWGSRDGLGRTQDGGRVDGLAGVGLDGRVGAGRGTAGRAGFGPPGGEQPVRCFDLMMA